MRSLLIVTLTALAGWAGPGEDEDRELRAFVAAQEARMLDGAVPPEKSRDAARVAVTALDRAARQATDPERRADGWERAAAVLDRYVGAWPDRAEAGELRAQAGRLRADAARTRLDAWLLEPGRADPREAARGALDAVVIEMKRLAASDPGLRLDLARALADRAEMEDEGSEDRSRLEREALAAVPEGSGRVLRAELLGRLGRARDGLAVLDEGGPIDRAAEDLARAELLARDGRYEEAIAALGRAEGLTSEARAGRIAGVAARAIGAAGDVAAREGWSKLWREKTRGLPGREARRAVLDLARALPGALPEDLDGAVAAAVAEGRAAAGDREGAARAWELAARGMEDPTARASPRLKAASSWLAAGRTESALAILSGLRRDEAGGASRTRAAWLEALALEETGRRDEAIAVLEWIVNRDEDRREINPARLRLGRLLADRGDRDAAEAVWDSIPSGTKEKQDAWVEAFTRRLDAWEELNAMMGEVEARDRQEMNAYLDMAHQRIAGSEWESRLELARIRLQLSPQVNHYDMAARMLSAMRPRPLSGSNRSLLDGYAMVLSASTGSQEETLGKLRGWLPGASSGERLEIARLLERRASAARSELDRRRLGEPLGRVVEDRGAFAMGGERAEAAILGVRSLQLTGRGREAVEEALDGLPSPGNRAEPETERARARIELELGRTDAGLGRLDRLAGAYREGSPGWWRARLELASGCLWAGRKGQAAEVLDAAAVLYPERGDAAIGEVWEALRARAGRGSPRREKKG